MARLDRPLLLCSALLCSVGAAWGSPTLPSAPDTAFHLGQKALDVIGQIAMANLPPQLDLPEVDRPLGLLGMVAHVSNGTIAVTPHSLNFTPAAGSLGIAALLDVSGAAHVSITNGYTNGDTASCDISVTFTQLSAAANVSLAVDAGAATVGLSNISATVPPGDLSITFSNCILDLLNGGTTDAVAQAVLDMAQGLIGDKLSQIVPPMLQQQIGAMLNQTGSIDGYSWAAKLTTLEMNASGIDAYAQVAVDYEGAMASCLPENGSASVSQNLATSNATMALPTQPTSSIVVGVSTSLISSAVSAAWQSGLLCIDDSVVGKLGFDPSQLIKLVPGLPEGLTMHFSVSMDKPPVLTIGGDGGLTMSVVGAELLILLQAPNEAPAGVDIVTDFSIGVTPTVDPTSGSIYATLGQMSMNRLEINAGASSSTYNVDPERLTVLLQDVIAPIAAQKLQGLPVSAASFAANSPFGTVYTWLDSIDSENRAVYLGIEAFVQPSSPDTVAPQTLLQKTPGAAVRAGMVRFQVGGSDDVTPPQLIRYEWSLDGGPVSKPAFGQVISVPVTAAGMHTFKVAAVDLAGNVDPNAQTSTFSLDTVPPTLTMTQTPSVVVRSSSVTLAFTGTDDQTPSNLLSYGYRVGVRQPGGELTDVKAVQPTGLAGGAATVTVDGLKAGNTYDVTLLLYDAAGNVTSQKIGFGVASSGCSMGGNDPASLGALLCVGLALLFARRRRIVA